MRQKDVEKITNHSSWFFCSIHEKVLILYRKVDESDIEKLRKKRHFTLI